MIIDAMWNFLELLSILHFHFTEKQINISILVHSSFEILIHVYMIPLIYQDFIESHNNLLLVKYI